MSSRRTEPTRWGPRLDYILHNALIMLLDQPEATLADVLRHIG